MANSRAPDNRPTILLSDEPNGQFESHTGATISQSLYDIAKKFGVTVIVASHDSNIVTLADRIIELRDRLLVKFNENSIYFSSFFMD